MSTSGARILCIGDELSDLIGIQCELDSDFDFVIVSSTSEADVVLAGETPFDVIISDRRVQAASDVSLLATLTVHSPSAERIIIVSKVDRDIIEIAAADSRIMRLLMTPLEPNEICDAVSDALLRHRARNLRASALPNVTPAGGHPCCEWKGVGAQGAA